MISKALQDAINDQINKELYSSYLYLSMAAHFENENLAGFAKWMHVQEGEEREHAMKLYEFLVDRGGKVVLKEAGAGPPAAADLQNSGLGPNPGDALDPLDDAALDHDPDRVVDHQPFGPVELHGFIPK